MGRLSTTECTYLPTLPDLGLGCVCLGTGFGFAPPILAGVALPILAGVLGCACLCARSGYTLSSLARLCVSGACVLGFGFQLWPAIRGWGVGVCVFVFVCVLRLYPATPCSGSWCMCLGSGVRFHVANSGCGFRVCVFVCALRLYPASLLCADLRSNPLGSCNLSLYLTCLLLHASVYANHRNHEAGTVQAILKKVSRTGPCHSMSSTASTRILHPLPRDL